MKASFLRIGCLILLLFAQPAMVHGEGITLGPHITIHERAFDFKAVKEGSTLEHAFRVLNKGDQVLEIKRVKTS